MARITKFEDLECWQHARELSRHVYNNTKYESFRKDFRLTSQIRNASTSIMSNIAEGFTRHSNKEFIQFLFIAISSVAEVESDLYIALDQDYIERKQFEEVYEKATITAKLISGLIRYLLNKETR